MKYKRKYPPERVRLWMAAGSLAVYLFVYAVFSFLQAFVEGGALYLGFLLVVPWLFIVYEISVGVFSFLYLRKIGIEVLFQTLALLLFLLFSLLTDVLSGTALGALDYILDAAALVACPVLVLVGARVTRFFLRYKKKLK